MCAAQLGAAARLGQPNLVETFELVGQNEVSCSFESLESCVLLSGCDVVQD